MNIAIIGLGEVGRCFATPLLEAGFTVALCEPRPSEPAKALSARTGLLLHPAPGAWLGQADWVLSCVTGAEALNVIREALPHLAKAASYADFTTAAPDVKREAATLAAAREIRFLDVAIMGAISLSLVRTPLLVAGENAAAFQHFMGKAGGRVAVIDDGRAGDAISLKILRSVFTKGLEALSVELLMSAERQGVREALYEQLRDIDETPLRSFLDMLVRTHVVHARRRLHEVRDARAELETQGLPSLVLGGVEARFRHTCDRLNAEGLETPDPDIDDALRWLLAEAPVKADSGN